METVSMEEREAQAATEAEQPKTEVETPLESVASICTVLAVGLFLMTFIFQNYVIPSGSMEDTLLVGDHVFVDRITLAPPTRWAPFVHYRDVRRGDIIVFLKPNPVPPDPPDIVLVKRTIGVAGDRIHLDHGIVYLNGVAQDEPHALMPRNDDNSQHAYEPLRDDFPAHGVPQGSTARWADEEPAHVVNGDLVVPPGYVFAMGDNRTESLDGRFWGFVPTENILGRPLFNYWSYETDADTITREQETMGSRIGSFFTTALHIFDKTRWKRTFHLIK
jgi:signal peptidase I